VQRLVTEALGLSRDEREELGHTTAWDEEIERRAADDVDGSGSFVDDGPGALRSLRDELLGR
jgi:hypothetical protein